MFGGRPAAASRDSTSSIAEQRLKPTIGWSPISFSVGARLRPASGRAGGDDEDVRVAQELDRLVRPRRARQRPEREVELAALDHLHELALVRGLLQEHLDAGMRVREAAEERGEDADADALERPDAQASGVARLERVHVRLRGEQPSLDRVRVPQEHVAGLGQRDRASGLPGARRGAARRCARASRSAARSPTACSRASPRPGRTSPRRRSP